MRTILIRSGACAGVVLLLILSATHGDAQIPAGSSARTLPTPSATPEVIYDDKPFDLGINKLPANYQGVDPFLLKKMLRGRELKKQKDEFETTAQFQLRIQKQEAEPILGSIKSNSTIAFVTSDLDASYDADQELMRVAIDPSTSFNVRFGPEAKQIIVQHIKMDIPTAKRTKPNLRALAVVQNPRLSEQQFYVLADLLEIWFFDGVTGEVFIKKKVEKVTQAEAKENVDMSYGSPKEMIARAQKLFDAGLDQKALELLRRVLTIEPTSSDAYLLAGRVSQHIGDLRSAISNLKTAIFWESKKIEAYILLSRIFLELGDRAQAFTYAKSATEIDQNNQEAAALLRQLSETRK